MPTKCFYESKSFRDDVYGSLFQQTLSIETRGESSSGVTGHLFRHFFSVLLEQMQPLKLSLSMLHAREQMQKIFRLTGVEMLETVISLLLLREHHCAEENSAMFCQHQHVAAHFQ